MTERTTRQTEVVEQSKPKKETNIKNKGTGAGGSNTNKNGLSYEEITKLDDRITIIEKNKFSNIIIFNDNNKKLFTKTKQANFFKCMEDEINYKY